MRLPRPTTPNGFVAVFLAAPFVLATAALSAVSATGFALPAQTVVANGAAAQALEDHYDEHFPLRGAARNVWAAAQYAAFNEGADGLVVGDNGWFFTEQEFRPSARGEANLIQHLAWIARVHDRLAARDIRLVVSLVPAKARIYAEQRGGRDPAGLHPHVYDRARRSLHALGIAAPDTELALRRCKPIAPVFMKTDTHWSPAGARCVAHALANVGSTRLALSTTPATLYTTRQTGVDQHTGDLMTYLPMAPLFSAWMPPAEPVPVVDTAARSHQAQDLFGGPTRAPVVLVGTSYSAQARWNFAGALRAAMQRDVANLSEAGQGPFRPMARLLATDELRALSPALVIWEIPERYFLQPDETTDATVGAGLRLAHACVNKEVQPCI